MNTDDTPQATGQSAAYVTQRDAYGLLLRVTVERLRDRDPSPIAFRMPTTGPRAGQIIWGDPHRRWGQRLEDEVKEGPEDLMTWDDIIRHVRAGRTAEQINDDLHERAAAMRTRWGF